MTGISSSKRGLSVRILPTLIHEFMHATDYRDPEKIQSLSRMAYTCFSRLHDWPFEEAFGHDVEEGGRMYRQCLDNAHPLFGQLGDLYNDLPEDIELNEDRWSTAYQRLTAILSRWGSYENRSYSDYHRTFPRWYTELYAQSVFIRHLPAGLEEHYSQYFQNREDIVDIFEILGGAGRM